MDLRKQLTSEALSKKFKSSFELVNHAIGLAKRIIDAGHPIEGTEEVRNQAFEILSKIASGNEEIPPPRVREEITSRPPESTPIPKSEDVAQSV